MQIITTVLGGYSSVGKKTKALCLSANVFNLFFWGGGNANCQYKHAKEEWTKAELAVLKEFVFSITDNPYMQAMRKQ